MTLETTVASKRHELVAVRVLLPESEGKEDVAEPPIQQLSGNSRGKTFCHKPWNCNALTAVLLITFLFPHKSISMVRLHRISDRADVSSRGVSRNALSRKSTFDIDGDEHVSQARGTGPDKLLELR